MRYFAAIILCLPLLCICTNESQAGIVSTFSNRSAFQSELTTSQNIDFEANYASSWNPFHTAAGYVSNGVDMHGYRLDSGTQYLYTTESSTNSYAVTQGNMFTGDALLGEGRGIIEMNLPTGQFAIGLDFVATEIGAGTPISFTFNVNGTDTISVTNSARTPSFVGIVSDQEITEFSVRTTTVARPPQFLIDNVTFGTVLVATPEPTAGLMLASGLGAILLRRRRV